MSRRGETIIVRWKNWEMLRAVSNWMSWKKKLKKSELRVFVLWLLVRPLPWQVRLHGRSKNLIKILFLLVFEGRWHGDWFLFLPRLSPLGVRLCFFSFLFSFCLPNYCLRELFGPIPNTQQSRYESQRHIRYSRTIWISIHRSSIQFGGLEFSSSRNTEGT